jgi:hypothetical protein
VPGLTASILLLPLFEKAAAAIAAGVVCGTFGGATLGAIYGWSRKTVEGDALRNGYLGALAALAVGLYDACNVYATSV